MPELLSPELADRAPEGEKETALKRGLVTRQTRELAPCGNSVTCPCGRKVAVRYAYRCFFCMVWFCQVCAKRHFTASDHGPFGGGVP